MKRLAPVWVVLVLFGGAAAVASAQEKGAGTKTSAIAQTPEWLAIKSLVGSWGGVVEIEGKPVPTSVEMRLTGDGSAVMHVMDKDTPHEMVTMFHPDGERLLATHYCAAHNQPRMALVPSAAANQVAFSFLDGTNIGPGEEHMRSVTFTFTDADHHEEAWTSSGSPKPAIFRFARKK